MGWDEKVFLSALRESLLTFDREAVERHCSRLLGHLWERAEPYPESEAKGVLAALRRKRHFDLVERVADGLIQTGQHGPQIFRQLSQALLDQGSLTAGIVVLEKLTRDTERDPVENAEARGLLGRAYKQLYVNAGCATSKDAQSALLKSIGYYREVYEADPEHHLWHGINFVALLERGARDGVTLPGLAAGRDQAETVAAAILSAIEDRARQGHATMWDHATALEACLALGRFTEALEWTASYVREPLADAFELGSTCRQLAEVWGLELSAEPGARILPLLRAELLRRQGSSLKVEPSDQRRGPLDEVPSASFEKVLGTRRYVSYAWYRKGLLRCRAVARIGRESDRGEGTGFVVRGGDLHESLGDELLLLTNSHVVSGDRAIDALRPDDVVVTFQVLQEETATSREHAIERILFESPPSHLDVSLLRLVPALDRLGLEPCPLAPHLPTLDDDQQRAYVIGHPEGGTLSLSIDDNTILDHEEPPNGKPCPADRVLLHYRSPTTGGSSGSPVFNRCWQVIAVHHKGGQQMPKLNRQPGTHAANEGVWIQSIRDAIAQTLAP